jgi:hypothetical protein
MDAQFDSASITPKEKSMKLLTSAMAIAIVIQLASAQETVPLEKAQKAAKLVTRSTVQEGPFKLELDLEKPHALKVGECGILIIPDKSLSKESFAKANAATTPIGQLWMLHAAPALDGKVIPNNKLRFVTVHDGETESQVQLYYLGTRKADQDRLKLVVYAKDKEPLLEIPLKERQSKVSLPIELIGEKKDEGSGTLTLCVLGQYEAELILMKQEGTD